MQYWLTFVLISQGDWVRLRLFDEPSHDSPTTLFKIVCPLAEDINIEYFDNLHFLLIVDFLKSKIKTA